MSAKKFNPMSFKRAANRFAPTPSSHIKATYTFRYTEQFILRSEVLKLYRNVLRTIKLVSNEQQREELRKWARQDFENTRHQTDEEAIKMLLTKGKMQLTELTKTLQLAK